MTRPSGRTPLTPAPAHRSDCAYACSDGQFPFWNPTHLPAICPTSSTIDRLPLRLHCHWPLFLGRRLSEHRTLRRCFHRALRSSPVSLRHPGSQNNRSRDAATQADWPAVKKPTSAKHFRATPTYPRVTRMILQPLERRPSSSLRIAATRLNPPKACSIHAGPSSAKRRS